MKPLLEKKLDQTNAVIYCRVSSIAQTKRGDGINSQRTRCLEFAGYKNYEVAEVFSDNLSGSLVKRPGMQAMLAYLRKHRANPHVVLIDDISRLARSVKAHMELRVAIAMAGGVLESPSHEFVDDADGEMTELIKATVSQHQMRKNAEQTVNRMRARLLNGYWVYSTPPRGYRFQKTPNEGNILVRDEPLASIVTEALEGYASGRFETQAEVKRFLEAQPLYPKDLPNGEIRNQRIKDLLTQHAYAGYIQAPKWDVPLREARHEALISFATYHKIQERLKGTAKAAARKDINIDFPLRGFVLCGDCNKPLTACWSKGKNQRYAYYLCHNRECESHRKSIPRDKIESEFETLLEQLQPTENLYRIVRTMFRDAWDQRLTHAAALATSVKREAAKLEKQIEQLLDRIVDAASPTVVTAYEKRIAKLEKEKLLMAENLSSCGKPQRPFEEMFEHAMNYLANPRRLWCAPELEYKRAVLKLTFADRLAYCRKSGFRTPKTTMPFKALAMIQGSENEMAHRGRFELPTPRFVV